MSILSRSAVAIASLAVGSAALVAAPAHADTPSSAVTPAGVTRETVLTAAAGVRSMDDSTYPTTTKALRSIVNRSCNVTSDDGEALVEVDADSLPPAAHADGLVVFGYIVNFAQQSARECVVGAVAAVDPGFTLTGNASLTVNTVPTDAPGLSIAVGPTTINSTLSGDVTTTTFSTPQGESLDGGAIYSANGSSVRVTKVTTTQKVTDKKTKAQKKVAKKAYAKRLKAAKASYAKALKKAGSDKTKKAAAKKAYANKKASAKAKYKYAIADYKLVKKTTSVTDSRPFTIATPVL